MTVTCAPFDPNGPYIRGVLSFVECQSLNVAETGYRALGAGTPFSTALDGFLVIAVALFGYRMLLGQTPALRDGVVLVAKFGMVLALALHWSAYQPLVFNVATRLPQDIVSSVLPGRSSVAGTAEADLVDRLERVDQSFAAILHPERELALTPQPADRPVNAAPPGAVPGPELAPETRDYLLSADSWLVMTYLSAAVGIRIALALLLTTGPLFVATFLFAPTRSLFGGWVRALVATMLCMMAVPLVVAFELALVEPMVIALVQAFNGGVSLQSLPEKLWVTSGLFAAAMALALLLVIRAAIALRFPQDIRIMQPAQLWAEAIAAPASYGAPQTASGAQVAPPRDHAQRVVDAARAAERRDHPVTGESQARQIIERDRPRSDFASSPRFEANGGPHMRATRGRVSAAARRRDGN